MRKVHDSRQRVFGQHVEELTHADLTEYRRKRKWSDSETKRQGVRVSADVQAGLTQAPHLTRSPGLSGQGSDPRKQVTSTRTPEFPDLRSRCTSSPFTSPQNRGWCAHSSALTPSHQCVHSDCATRVWLPPPQLLTFPSAASANRAQSGENLFVSLILSRQKP